MQESKINYDHESRTLQIYTYYTCYILKPNSRGRAVYATLPHKRHAKSLRTLNSVYMVPGLVWSTRQADSRTGLELLARFFTSREDLELVWNATWVGLRRWYSTCISLCLDFTGTCLSLSVLIRKLGVYGGWNGWGREEDRTVRFQSFRRELRIVVYVIKTSCSRYSFSSRQDRGLSLFTGRTTLFHFNPKPARGPRYLRYYRRTSSAKL